MAVVERKVSVPRIRAKTPIGILKAVVRIIREEPRRYYQNDWVRQHPVYQVIDNPGGFPLCEAVPLPPCGTVSCVAGWIGVGMRGPNETAEDVDDDYSENGFVAKRAARALGINELQAEELFAGSAITKQWNREGRRGSTPKVGTKRYVEMGIRHIERFMRNELGYTGPKL